MAVDTEKLVTVGRIGSAHGVRGWVKIHSFTEPRNNLMQYRPWRIKQQGQWREIEPCDYKTQGTILLAKLPDCDDRNAANLMTNADIAVYRHQLSDTLGDDTYYWTDLEGCTVINQQGITLGKVSHMMATGSNDVLVIEGEKAHLVPFLQGNTVLEVNLQLGTIHVDWDTNF